MAAVKTKALLKAEQTRRDGRLRLTVPSSPRAPWSPRKTGQDLFLASLALLANLARSLCRGIRWECSCAQYSENGWLQLRSGKLQLRSGFLQLRSGGRQLRSGRRKLRSGKLQLRSGRLQLRSGLLQLRSRGLQLRSGFLQLRSGFHPTRAAAGGRSPELERGLRSMRKRDFEPRCGVLSDGAGKLGKFAAGLTASRIAPMHCVTRLTWE